MKNGDEVPENQESRITGPIRTEVIIVNPLHPDDRLLLPAALALRHGELAAFPTETVYGLGANALDRQAVARIFVVKGRPQDNPLIVHLADLDHLTELVDHLPSLAAELFAAFSPGPLTLVLPRSKRIPDQVTAGLDTVAIRLPSHPVARRLIQLAGVPLAAPSANRSGRPSPTRAWHVSQDLEGLIPFIVDGGACQFGLESTVVDVTGKIPVILRPGSITASDIRRVAGCVAGAGAENLSGHSAEMPDYNPENEDQVPRAPGMKYRHYAPQARVVLAQASGLTARLAEMKSLLAAWQRQPAKIGIFACRNLISELPGRQADARDEMLAIKPTPAPPAEKRETDTPDYYCFSYGDEPDPETAANALFHAMRSLDKLGVAVILAEGLPDEGLGAAYMNRLRKAAGSQEQDRKSED